MTTKEAERARGFSLVEFVVVLVVVSIISAILLDRVKFYQEHAEKATMEATAAAIQAGLHLRMAGYLASGHDREIGRLANENPVEWLARKPANYAGAFDSIGAAEQVSEGSWYFDLSDRTLVYRVRYGRAFVPDESGKKEVRYRANIQYGQIGDTPGLTGLKVLEFAPVHPYRWTID
jgi:prepilin-type N-terminal cleavage/methylation domain-containing protein